MDPYFVLFCWIVFDGMCLLGSGVTSRGAGEQSAPRHFSPGNFCCPTGKKGQGKKGKRENGEEKKETLKGKRWEIENGRGKGMKVSRGPFYCLLFVCLFVCFVFVCFVLCVVFLFSLFLCLFVCLFFVCLFVCLFVFVLFLFVCLFVCLFVFFAFSLFETTKICLGSTQMDNFHRKKSYFTPAKNQENWLCAIWKISLLRPLLFSNCSWVTFVHACVFFFQLTLKSANISFRWYDFNAYCICFRQTRRVGIPVNTITTVRHLKAFNITAIGSTWPLY